VVVVMVAGVGGGRGASAGHSTLYALPCTEEGGAHILFDPRYTVHYALHPVSYRTVYCIPTPRLRPAFFAQPCRPPGELGAHTKIN
jgi:hypothetical protein